MSPVLPEGSGNASAEQAVVFGIDDRVTLANGSFQALTVDDGNRAANISNQFSLRQFLSRQRNTFTANSEHIGNKVVRHYQVIRI